MYILSQVLVWIADVFYVLSMLNANKKGLVFYLMISDVLFASHYMCLGGWTGAATIFVDVVYLLIMYILEKKEKTKYNVVITVITMFITIGLAILTWDTALSLLPMFSMLLYLAGMIFTNTVFVKLGSLLRNILNVVYMFILASYLGAGLEMCLTISAITGIIVDARRHKREKQQVAEVENGENN